MTTNKIIIIQALKIFLGIIAFFFIMKVLGLEKNVALRLLNFVIVLWGVNGAVKKNVKVLKQTEYLSNSTLAFATSMLSVGFVVLALIIYVSFIDSSLVEVMKKTSIWGSRLNLQQIIFSILIEGVASSIITSLIVLQYWKNYKVKVEE